MLEVKNIKMSYGSKSIIDDISFVIEKRTITSIIGPNGCGKSTLLRGISTNKKIDDGEIILDNKSIYSYKNKHLAKKIAILPQIHTAPEDVTVKELVGYGRFPYMDWVGRLSKSDYEKIDQTIEKVGLSHLKERKLLSLSGGERQIAWIAMALAQEPEIILLDEPTTYLDISHQSQVMELIKSLNQEMNLTVVMVLHDINQACRYSHNIIAIKNGSKIIEGSSDVILDRKILHDVFGVNATVYNNANYKYFMLD